MGKTALLFPGQGAQYVGMGLELYSNFSIVRETLDSINHILGFELLETIFNGPESELTKTDITQPAIFAVSIAILRLIQQKGIKAQAAAGLSLGEYSALAASGILKFDDTLLLVRKRGKFMQEAVPEGVGKMAAILGLKREPINGILKQASRYGVVEVANYNCPGQVVISGERHAVEKAMEFAYDMGALNSAALQVNSPFHSSLLKSAGDKLHDELLNCRFYKGDIAVVANIDADYYSTGREAIINKLYQQVFSPVLFEDSINKLIADGFDTFIEVGPGKTLSRLVKRINRNIMTYNVEDMESLENTVLYICK